MEEDHNHLIEVSSELELSINQLTATFNILNLTLQYVPYKIISPNPILFHIESCQGILDPCDSKDITVTAVITSSMNFQCFEKNNTITIFTHENSETQWEAVEYETIQRNDIQIKIIRNNYPTRPIQDNVIIAQIYNNIPFTEESKRLSIDCVMEKYGKTTNYNTLNTLLIFKYNKPVCGQVHLIAQPNLKSHFILITYTPSSFINVLPKYPIEPMSPQSIRKKIPKKVDPPPIFKSTPVVTKEEQKNLKNQIDQELKLKKKQQSQPTQQQSPESIKNSEEQTHSEIIESPQPPVHILNEHSTSNSDQQLYNDIIKQVDEQQTNKPSEFTLQLKQTEQIVTPQKPKPRIYQSEIIRPADLELFKQEKNELSIKQRSKYKKDIFNKAPIEFEKAHLLNEKDKQQNNVSNSLQFKKQLNLNVVNKFNTYSKIKFVILFRDHSYLITVSDKEVITVWSLHLSSEEGKIRDHSELKKIRMTNIVEWLNSNEKQFATEATDQQIRIFSIDEMRLKYIFKIDDFSSITSIAFLPDKDYVCIAGMPLKEFSIFGSKYPKHRFIRLYKTTTLKEILSYKITASEGQLLSPIEYTDNENMKHARLNNILVVNKGYKDKDGGEIVILMLDMNDKCTIILTLTHEQIQVCGIQSLHYLPLRGSFVVVEKNQANSVQQNKIFVINVKQLQTDDGLKSGIVCKQFEEQSILDDQIYVLPKQEYILKVKGDVVHLIDLKTETQSTLQVSQQMGDNPRNIVLAGRIVRIEGESLQILELLN